LDEVPAEARFDWWRTGQRGGGLKVGRLSDCYIL